jgi:two-component system chemotaxis sensor kinase CheA
MNFRSEDDFYQKLLATFAIEAREHVQTLRAGLSRLALGMPSGELLETLYREAHSLKGAARSVTNREIESLCHHLESLFSSLKKGEIAWGDNLLALLAEGGEILQRLVALLGNEFPGADRTAVKTGIKAWEENLSRFREDPTSVRTKATTPEASRDTGATFFPGNLLSPLPPADTVRVNLARLESLLTPADDLLQLKLTALHRVEELQNIRKTLREEQKKAARADKGIKLLRQLARETKFDPGQEEEINDTALFFEENQRLLASLAGVIGSLVQSSRQDARWAGNILDDWREALREALMLPFGWLWEGYPLFVADVAREQGKKVRLLVCGADIAVDRRVLEEMKDAFTHLIRNALDHGLEKPEERQGQGKPPEGTLAVEAIPLAGGRVRVIIADDGRGVNLAQVKNAALKMGLATAEDLDCREDQALLELMFYSGLSTLSNVTSLSGRGLGLAIVREKLEALGGTIRVESKPHEGTKFILDLPLTQAAFRVVVIRAGGRLFALPASQVEAVTRIAAAQIRSLENRPVISWRGESVYLFALQDIWELPPDAGGEDYQQLVIVRQAQSRLALKVEEILAEQESLVKGLAGEPAATAGIGGVTILGSGRLVPVLNIPELIHLLGQRKSRATVAAVAATKKRGDYLLVAEDSITSRTLLKNILEAAGYRVRTAVDGQEALTWLMTEEFDLVVTDVEMPRMNGLELTRRIRREEKLSSLPVILVTARETAQDREAGLLAGANAYLIKSSFDQSNLLAAIERLL